MKTKRLAACGMGTALGVVLMLFGSFLGLGMYAAPMLVGLGLVPFGKTWGVRVQLMMALAIGLLSLMLVADVEQNLMFLCFLGWYPALRPRMEKLSRLPRLVLKLTLFNGIVVALEILLVRVLAPVSMSGPFAAALLILANLTFLVYDMAIPRFEVLMRRYLGRFLPKS